MMFSKKHGFLTALMAFLCLLMATCGTPTSPIAQAPTPAESPSATQPPPTPTATATPTPVSVAPVTATPPEAPAPEPEAAMFRGGPEHPGLYPGDYAGTRWTFATGAEVVSSPVIFEGVVYVGGIDGYLYALDLETGEERWAWYAQAPVVSSPLVFGGGVYIGTAGGQVIGVDLDTGELAWSYEGSIPVQSSAAIAAGTLFVGTEDGTFYALALETQDLLWQFKAGASITSSPAVADGVVAFGSSDTFIYALDAATGEERWRFETGAEVLSSPAVSGDVVFAGSNDGHLYALDLERGDLKWQFAAGGPVLSSPVVSANTVYIATFGATLHSLDAATGEEQWVFEAGDAIFASPAVTPEGTVLFGSINGALYAVDAETGTELWRFQTEGEVWSSAAVAGDAVVFGGYDYNVYALSFAEQAVAQAPTPTPTSPPLQPTPTLMPEPEVGVSTGSGGLPWWNDRIFYEVFVRSFYDSDGDGTGDLQGLIQKLDYLNDGDPETDDDLGITGIWLMPVAQSPSYHGYDVIDYLTVEEDYGTNEDFLELMEAAHQRGIAVIVDLVQNHTSNQHPWFLDAIEPGSEHDSWYVWSTKLQLYGGPWGQQVWHRAGQRYYYGLFWEGMPDLNYRNGAVTDAMYDVTAFWLEEMGVDGYRLDAIRHLIEEGEVQENTAETHAWLQGFYRFVHTIAPDALLVGEVWTESSEVAKYIDGHELDVAFEFDLAQAILEGVWRQNAGILAEAQAQVLALYPQGQYAAFLTNHDQNRVMNELRNDVEAAKAAATILLTNPGLPFIYYGEEIGMRGAKPDERIRTPMHWDGSPAAGFTSGTPWEALAEDHETVNIAGESDDPASLLNHYRTLIRLRQEQAALRAGDMLLVDSDNRAVYSFLRALDGETLLVVVNLDDEPVSDYALTLSSGPLSGEVCGALLLGEGQVRAPVLNGPGGFEAYTPLDTLPARGSLVIDLAPCLP